MLKVGIGTDLHRLALGRPLILGGVSIPSQWGSIAHSDGDALIHALIDSLVSPVAATDIGRLFPDSDPAYRGADSMHLLREASGRFLQGVTIHNIDAVITLDAPRLSPHIDSMRGSIAQALGIETAQVTIKAKTSENTQPYSVEAQVVSLMEI